MATGEVKVIKRRMGRPRTRPPIRRVTLELNKRLLDNVEFEARMSGKTLRYVVETALHNWFYGGDSDEYSAKPTNSDNAGD